jgi:anaerobic magnesium-protoporphyrin IX monomethyl ester cyclase
MCLSRMREAALTMAGYAKIYGATVSVFSSDASDHLETYFDNGVDYVFCGEAEITLGEFADAYLQEGRRYPKDIKGLAYMESGAVYRSERRGVLRDLDMLPIPAWDLVDTETYRRIWKERHGYFSVNISTTRGCPFHCNWCAKPLYGQVYNSRSPENVAAEMKFLKDEVRPDHLWITDDIFGLKPGWVHRFAEAVQRENASIPYKCLSRADLLLMKDTIVQLRESGCRSVWIGAESGSQKILDAMEKGTTVGQIYESARRLRDAGIRVGFFLQFGYPGETRADIELTLKMVRDCNPDEIGVSVSYPLPGTPFYERVREQLKEKQNWITSEDFDPMFASTYPKEYYRTLHRVVHKKFSVWRGMRATRRILKRPLRIDRASIRSLVSMVYSGATLPSAMRTLKILEDAHER